MHNMTLESEIMGTFSYSFAYLLKIIYNGHVLLLQQEKN